MTTPARDPLIHVGSVVQIDPEYDARFGGCLLVVEEVASWGVQGVVRVPGRGEAPYRVTFEHVAYIGELQWGRP